MNNIFDISEHFRDWLMLKAQFIQHNQIKLSKYILNKDNKGHANIDWKKTT